MGAIMPYKFTTKDGNKILLRTGGPHDASAIVKLSREVIRENDTLITTIEEFTTTEEQQREFIYFYNQDPSNNIIVAESQGNIIGLLTFQRGFFQRYAHHGSVGMIVDRNWRGKGVGKALLTTLVQWANYNPLLDKLCLEVLASNKNAISLYKSIGFIEEGRQKHQVKYSNGRYDDIVIMGLLVNYS